MSAIWLKENLSVSLKSKSFEEHSTPRSLKAAIGRPPEGFVSYYNRLFAV